MSLILRLKNTENFNLTGEERINGDTIIINPFLYFTIWNCVDAYRVFGDYWQFAEVINSFISSSLGSSIMYFCTKIFGSNPAHGCSSYRITI